MVVSPFEERYATKMNEIFEEKNKYSAWMKVEVALAEVHAELGNIPKDAPQKIKDAVSKVDSKRIKEIESEIHHDLMAMVKALSEQSGDAGKYVHFGATSYDIEDTATALIFRKALDLVILNLNNLKSTLSNLALTHKSTVCIGRTHGQHAVPTTYGMKFALYFQELCRNISRLKNAKSLISVGKMSGAVGTMATFGKDGFLIQSKVMDKLGLKPDVITNQVVQRDRHAEVLYALTTTAALFEKIAKEIRNLQRTEIGEISEPFSEKQVGSSAMPQKRNPHKSERICSLARLLRGYLSVAIENISLEHERDLTNSANERVIFPSSFIAVDYMSNQLNNILKGLVVDKDNIKRNLEFTNGLIMAERVMIYLTKKGMPRQEAHEKVREIAQFSFKQKSSFKKNLIEKGILASDEADDIFDYSSYIGLAEQIVEKAVSNSNCK